MKAFKLGIAQTEGVNVVKSTEDLVSQYHEVPLEQPGTFPGVKHFEGVIPIHKAAVRGFISSGYISARDGKSVARP